MVSKAGGVGGAFWSWGENKFSIQPLPFALCPDFVTNYEL
jgi:hypothetical protein